MSTDTQTPVQLTISDLATMKSLIEIACARGAFQAAEMRNIGETYDKLTAFLNDVMSQAQAQEDQPNPQGETL